jgi:hypothetical protein
MLDALAKQVRHVLNEGLRAKLRQCTSGCAQAWTGHSP